MKTDAFAYRHIGPRVEDLDEMLKVVGADSLKQLISETIPEDILLESDLDLSEAMTENEFLNHI